ncbi:protein SSUH2 homolog [Physella acuta]|uniref:protein SSUH2 homolog n=1 Tax=Physella acuta TaxID=109671 RepID=UPI0027DE5733|nr:protein SSUH2 homolog [Physella acuta]
MSENTNFASGSRTPYGAVQGSIYPSVGQHAGASQSNTKATHDASVPPLEQMDKIPGYAAVGFDEGMFLAPPSQQPRLDEASPQQDQRPRSTFNYTPLTREQAREAIIHYAADHCCYGNNPAVKMEFTNMASTSSFHYTLETFGESRSTKWTSHPYLGEGLVVTGPPPGPWDVMVAPPVMFQKNKKKIEVPNTASVKPCHNCNGRGNKSCGFCQSSGRRKCLTCNGTGRSRMDAGPSQCMSCQGGWTKCYSCNGAGHNVCTKCEGRGNLRWYIQLTVQWTNHTDHHVIERTALPNSLITRVTGLVAFEESLPRVSPVSHFLETEINTASHALVNKHACSFPTERILMQRHVVQIVPVTEVSFTYEDMMSSFFVYGNEHKVYAPNYPEQCCCGCSVL